jgi:hypothetical protein
VRLPDRRATLQVSFRAPAYREEVLPKHAGSLGTGVSVSDGREGVFGWSSKPQPLPAGFVPARDFSPAAGPDAGRPSLTWADLCSKGESRVVSRDNVAGRGAWHLRCGPDDSVTPSGPWQLWIDARTGVLLKVVGPITPESTFRPLGCSCTTGGFEMRSIAYDPVFPPNSFLVGKGRIDTAGAIANDLTWQRVPGTDRLFQGAKYLGLISWRGGFVVRADQAPGPVPYLWASPDGVTWTKVDPAQFGPGFADVAARGMAIAPGGPGLIMVGNELHKLGEWTSADGLSWNRVDVDEAPFRTLSNGFGLSMAVGGPGFVLTGTVCSTPTKCGQGLWTSADGLTWRPLPHAATVFRGHFLQRVDSSGGYVVAVEDDQSGAGISVVWLSTDGVHWRRDPFQQNLADQNGTGEPLHGSFGWAVQGIDKQDRAAIWTAEDALTWKRSPYDADVWGLQKPQWYPSMTPGGPGLVVWASDRWGAVIWDWHDGVTWKRVPYDQVMFGPGTSISSMAAGGPGLVAVGQDGKQVVIWIGTFRP